AFDAGRVRFRIRTARREGAQKEYSSGELAKDDAHRVIAAVGLGNGGDARVGAALLRQGIGRIVAGEDQALPGNRGSLGIAPAGEEGIDLPLLFEEGKILPWALEPRAMRRRGAACVTPSGHVVFAMATSDSDEPTALALLRVGCKRAVALDRG